MIDRKVFRPSVVIASVWFMFIVPAISVGTVIDVIIDESSGTQTHEPVGLRASRYAADWLVRAHAGPLCAGTVWASGWFVFYPELGTSYVAGDIQFRKFTVYAHRRSGGWEIITNGVSGDYFTFDFGGSYQPGSGFVAPWQASGDNTTAITVKARTDVCEHGFGYGGSIVKQYDGNSYDGWLVGMEVRTDLKNYLVAFGMDGKKNDGSLALYGGEGAGKFLPITNQWSYVGLSDLSRERLQADPPPIAAVPIAQRSLAIEGSSKITLSRNAGNISFDAALLRDPARMSVRIYNMNGALVRLIAGANSGAPLKWDLKNSRGASVNRGAYVYRLALKQNGTWMMITGSFTL